jgi:hypothetical protein
LLLLPPSLLPPHLCCRITVLSVQSFEFEQDPIKAAHRQRLQQQTSKQSNSSSSSRSLQQQASAAVSRDKSSSSNTLQQQQQQQQQLDGRIMQSGAVETVYAGDLASTKDAGGIDSSGLQQAASIHHQQRHKQQQNEQQQQQQGSVVAAWKASGCSWLLGHEPVRVMFRDHWREVMLLFWFETW